MSDRVFLDTNVLVYADDLDAGAKRDRARQLVREVLTQRTGVCSTQVLQEYYAVSTRKLGVDPLHARRKVELLASLDVVRVQVPDILAAIDLLRLHQLPFWDALILRAAMTAGCSKLLTEDFHDGRTLEGVRIENPFRDL